MNTPASTRLVMLSTELPEPKAQPLDPVIKKLSLVVSEKFVTVALFRLGEDACHPLLFVLRYSGGGHEASPSWSRPRGVSAPPGPFLFLTRTIVHAYNSSCQTLTRFYVL